MCARVVHKDDFAGEAEGGGGMGVGERAGEEGRGRDGG